MLLLSVVIFRQHKELVGAWVQRFSRAAADAFIASRNMDWVGLPESADPRWGGICLGGVLEGVAYNNLLRHLGREGARERWEYGLGLIKY